MNKESLIPASQALENKRNSQVFRNENFISKFNSAVDEASKLGYSSTEIKNVNRVEFDHFKNDLKSAGYDVAHDNRTQKLLVGWWF